MLIKILDTRCGIDDREAYINPTFIEAISSSSAGKDKISVHTMGGKIFQCDRKELAKIESYMRE